MDGATQEVTPAVVVAGHINIEDTIIYGRGSSVTTIGGAAVYAAVGASLAGGRVTLVSRAGRDLDRDFSETLESAGVELRIRRLQVPTMHSTTTYDSVGRRRFEMHNLPADLAALTPTAGEMLAVRSDVIHLGPLPASVALDVMERKVAVGSLDSHSAHISRGRADFRRTIELADLVLLSRAEWQELVGSRSPDAWLRWVPAGPAVVGAKLGEEGALVLDRDSGIKVRRPPFTVRVVDPTGAGDTFCGAFVVEWIRSRRLDKAVAVALAAASVVIEEYGALGALRRRNVFQSRVTSILSRPSSQSDHVGAS